MEALKRARLVADDATIESISLSRSGRTDRGVSGLGQVYHFIGLDCFHFYVELCRTPIVHKFCLLTTTEEPASQARCSITYHHEIMHTFSCLNPSSMQVVALNVRSRGKATQPLPAPEDEQDYTQSLNKGLPGDIRVLGWTDVSPNFSAR